MAEEMSFAEEQHLLHWECSIPVCSHSGLKATKPEVFSKIKHILHFPQYLSYLINRKDLFRTHLNRMPYCIMGF